MKKMVVSIAVVTVAVAAMLVMILRSESSSLFDANVEALTRSESGGEVVKCYCKTNWFSPNVCSANADGGYCGGDPCSDHDGNCR